jgi:hypothetical protein
MRLADARAARIHFSAFSTSHRPMGEEDTNEQAAWRLLNLGFSIQSDKYYASQ